jgi:SNF2 family DNA or RNA helicase
MNLLDKQKQAFDKLKRVKVGALFMEAGTGKTRTAMELIKSTDSDFVIWFTPFRTKDNLRAEIDKQGGLKCDIVGIESISNSDRVYLELYNKLSKSKKAFIVMDESLKVKNPDAKRTKRLLELSKLSEYRLILNGTPISRNLLDLWSQFQFLSPKIMRMDLAEFKNTFCEYVSITYQSISGYNGYTKEFIKQYHNLPYLYSLIEPYVFESKLSISVGVQEIELDYQLTDKELEEHDRIKNEMLDDKVLMARNNNIFLELTQKMQHNYSLSPDKFNLLDKILKDNDKVLIYAKYIDSQNALKKRYHNQKVMSIQKHTYGLNLQEYNVVVFWDKTWDYAQLEQIQRRVYRQGQTKYVKYYYMTSNAGLDRMINMSIENKSNLLEDFKKLSTQKIKQLL